MASVFLGDLDDFIAPAQACVNPLFASGAKGGVQLDVDEGVNVFLDEDAQVALNTDTRALVKGTGEGGKVAKVSLNDCLACSGCVTSAETVLMEQQSGGALLQSLADPRWRERVVSLSPAAMASVARHVGVPAAAASVAVSHILRSKANVDRVLDTSVPGRAALLLAAREFVDRHRAASAATPAPEAPKAPAADAAGKAPEGKRPRRPRAQGRKRHAVRWERPAVSTARSAAVTEAADGGGLAVRDDGWLPPPAASADAPPARLPVLCSECPGWICYVEKTAPEAIPYVSNVKSAMALASWVGKVRSAPPPPPPAARGAPLHPCGRSWPITSHS